MTYITKCFKHLKTIIIHKAWVFYYCCKAGIPWQGLMHDLSKFSPIEFFESAKYYTGKGSPINKCKQDKGYSLAWQHHKGRNPHHYEYWIDNIDRGGVPIKMPYKYAVELICDYLAAGKTYRGKDFTFKDEYEWFNRRAMLLPKIHSETYGFIAEVFKRIAITNVFDKETIEGVAFLLKY